MENKEAFQYLLGRQINPKANGEFQALCPLHHDTKASFCGNTVKGVWKCQAGCGGGDIKALAQRIGKDLPINNLLSKKLIKKSILDVAVECFVAALKGGNKLNPAVVYLREKKIKLETAEAHRFGYADVSSFTLKNHLLKQGFTIQEGVDAGLLRDRNSRFEDVFRNCLILPVIISGKVIYLVARKLGNNPVPKYLNLKGSVNFLFNQDILASEDEIVVSEGIIDAVTLLQNNIPAVGVLGAGGFKKEFVQKFSQCKKVYLSFDGDGAGCKGNLDTAKLMPEKSWIVGLPDGQDVNDFFLTQNKDQYRSLLAQSLRIAEYLILQIPRDMPALNLPAKLTPIVELVGAYYTAVDAAYFINHFLKRHFQNITGQDIVVFRKLLAESVRNKSGGVEATIQTQGELIQGLKEQVDSTVVHPIQDFYKGIMHYAIKVKNAPCIITSQPKLMTFQEAKNTGLVFKQSNFDISRFSNDAAARYFDGSFKVQATSIFEDIRKYLCRFIYFVDPVHLDYLALWAMGTYVFMIFRYFPYVWVTAEKGSGKTLLMEVLREIVFNGELLSNPTEAVVFRDVEYNKITMLLDEIEQLHKDDKDTHGAVMRVLNSGFNKSGKVKRIEKNSKGEQKIAEFSSYSPKMFAGINKISDVLQDRTVKIKLLRKRKDEVTDRFKVTDEIVQLQKRLRDELYVFGLTFGSKIYEQYQGGKLPEGFEHLKNRELDIWEPIILLAMFLDQNVRAEVLDRLAVFSKQSLREKVADSMEQDDTLKVLNVIHEMTRSLKPIRMLHEGKRTYNADHVFTYFKKHPYFEWLDKRNSLTTRLKRAHITCRQIRIKKTMKLGGKMGDDRMRVYEIDDQKLKDLYERYEMAFDNTGNLRL